MKLTIIWFSIGVTALAIVAPASTDKYDVQTDLTTILARDSMAPSPETEHECMEACVDAALPWNGRIIKAALQCRRRCHGHEKTEEELQKEAEKKKETEDAIEKWKEVERLEEEAKPKKTIEKYKKPEKVEKPEKTTEEDDKKPEKTEEPEKPRNPEKPEKTEKSKNPEKPEKTGKPEKPEKTDPDYLTFENEEEWKEWLKLNKTYEEVTPPLQKLTSIKMSA
ncbi:hypothetical protein D6C91_05879 [Aureobasidium pullulans]|uniref:Uncharacterized protein n=1 Tax=Aureobasidium pullulans TaxID=5580 RepID=A0A4S9T0T8_AURPU|nr:hypothetical protein D6C91_05879 [Aureobasidium pullulans]